MAFEDRDIRADDGFLRELLDLGVKATPTTVVETEAGREVISGFDRVRLRQALGGL